MAGQNNSFDMQIKLLMIGDSGKKKKEIEGSLEISVSFHARQLNDVPFAGSVLRCRENVPPAPEAFSPTFITTIGIDFKIKNIVLDDKRIKLQVLKFCYYHAAKMWLIVVPFLAIINDSLVLNDD